MPASPPKVSRRATRVWDRLRQWYGARLAEQYGTSAPPDWCTLIDRTDDDRLDAALSSARHASPIHPPTLGQIEAAIPKRDLGPRRQSIPERLAEFAIDKLTRELCAHQVARPWNYFGSHFRIGEVPQWKGVQVPACEACDRPSHRVLLDEMLTAGATVA